MNTEFFLNNRGDVRENQVRTRRANNNQVDVFSRDAGILDGILRSFHAQIGCQLVLCRYVTPFDARTGADPFVACVYDLLQVRIRHDAFRQIASCACDFRIDHAASCCNKLPICSGTWFWTSTSPVSIAC